MKEIYSDNVLALLNEREVKKLPAGKIKTSEIKGLKAGDVSEMKHNILLNGLITPLSVIGPMEDGKYLIVDGNRRYKALSVIIEKDATPNEPVPCYVLGGQELESKLRELALASNIVKRDKDSNLVIEYCEILYSEYLEGDIDRKDIPKALAKLTGFSKRQARNYFHLVQDAGPAVREALRNGDISVNDAFLITSTYSDFDEQAEAVKKLVEAGFGEKGVVSQSIRDDKEIKEILEISRSVSVNSIVTTIRKNLIALMVPENLDDYDITDAIDACKAFLERYDK